MLRTLRAPGAGCGLRGDQLFAAPGRVRCFQKSHYFTSLWAELQLLAEYSGTGEFRIDTRVGGRFVRKRIRSHRFLNIYVYTLDVFSLAPIQIINVFGNFVKTFYIDFNIKLFFRLIFKSSQYCF